MHWEEERAHEMRGLVTFNFLKNFKFKDKQRQSRKNHFCFTLFKNGFVKTGFEMVVIFTKMPLHAQ